MKTFVWLAAAAAGVMLAVAGCGKQDDGRTKGGEVRISGAGATFPKPLYEKWIAEYAKANPKAKISYNGIGSGGGITQISKKEVDFGASDAPMSDKELQTARNNGQDLLHIPMTMGAVVPVYNLAGLDASKPLKFSGAVLANLFSGKITRWNDEQIKKLNPDQADKLPDADVRIVHRDDPSGTTYVFTEFLAKAGSGWKASKNPDTWARSSSAAKGNDGVTKAVKEAQNTLGYVELNYAMENGLAYGDVQNKANNFVHASIASVSAAGNVSSLAPDLRVSLTDPPAEAKDAYPISSTTWILVPRTMSDPAKGKALVEFLTWCIHDGQKLAPALHYGPLPDALVKGAEAQLSSIK